MTRNAPVPFDNVNHDQTRPDQANDVVVLIFTFRFLILVVVPCRLVIIIIIIMKSHYNWSLNRPDQIRIAIAFPRLLLLFRFEDISTSFTPSSSSSCYYHHFMLFITHLHPSWSSRHAVSVHPPVLTREQQQSGRLDVTWRDDIIFRSSLFGRRMDDNRKSRTYASCVCVHCCPMATQQNNENIKKQMQRATISAPPQLN